MRTLALLVLGGAILSTHAAPVIGTVRLSQTTVVAGVPTQITVIAPIADSTLVPGSVNLLQVNADSTTTILATLHDDGLNGDALTVDTLFTTAITVNSPAATTIQLQVSAAFKGVLHRVRSSVLGVFVQPANATDLALTDLSKAIASGSTSDAVKFFADGDKASTLLSTLDSAGRQSLATAFRNARLLKSSPDLRVYGAPWTVAASPTPLTLTFTMWPDMTGAWVIGTW